MARLLQAYPDLSRSADQGRGSGAKVGAALAHRGRFRAIYCRGAGGMSLLVLAVAMANVTNLLFTRAADRERETGDSRRFGRLAWQTAPQLSAESVLLALGGRVVGTIAALLDQCVPGRDRAG